MSNESKKQLLMCERGIRAICERRKWQTRRMPVCLEEINFRPDDWLVDDPEGVAFRDTRRWRLTHKQAQTEMFVDSPFGGEGSMLWIREPWTFRDGRIFFTGIDPDCGNEVIPEPEMLATLQSFKRLEGGHPSLHLPHWASRYLITLSGIRLERANQLTAQDALEEGAEGIEDYLRWFADLHGSVERNPWVLALRWEMLLVGQGRDKKLVEKPGRV